MTLSRAEQMAKVVSDLGETKLFSALAKSRFDVVYVTDENSHDTLTAVLPVSPRSRIIPIDELDNWLSNISNDKAAIYKYVAGSFDQEGALLLQVQHLISARRIRAENAFALFADVFVALNAPYSRANPFLAKLDALRSGISLPSVAGKALASRVDTAPIRTNEQTHYMIVSLPRSGSTMLANILTLTGFCGYPREHVHNGVLSLAEFRDFSWQDWLNAVVGLNRTPNEVFGTKVISHFLFRALRIGKQNGADLFEGLKPGAKLIYLKRDDKVAQAISRHFARTSGFFKADLPFQQGKRRRAVKEVAYDFKTINAIVTRMESEEARLARVVKEFGADTLTVDYESLERDPEPEVHRILDFLAVNPGDGFQVPKPRTKKTRDARNQEFYQRFVRDRQKCS